MTNKDAFDLWWASAEKPPHSTLTIPAEIHEAVMALPPNERHDRAKVNEAVRHGLHRGPPAVRTCTAFRRQRKNEKPAGMNRRPKLIHVVQAKIQIEPLATKPIHSN